MHRHGDKLQNSIIYSQVVKVSMIDPYQIYEEIDISDDFNNTTILIIKLNKRIFIDNGNVCVTNGISGIDENKLRQLSNKTIYRNRFGMHGIGIYTLNENKIERYFWHNNEWKNFDKYYRRNIVEDVINDNLVLPKFGIKMLKIAIENKIQDAVQQIIELTQDYSENYMTIISLNLAILCDYYPDFIIKYISSTSIILSPYCIRIGNSKNPSLHSYANIIYIKESNTNNNVFKSISANYEVVQICVYQDDSKRNDHENNVTKKNHDIKSKIITILKKMITGLKIIMMIPKSNSIWNEFLYKPKSILFCNIDSNHFYNWWNFTVIIDFKWKTFGRSISDSYFELLFIISIIFGSTFLIFEIRQYLWNYKHYFKDILWNLFVVGAYLLPIITSIFWLINFSQPILLTSLSIILLSFKFLLFFRVFESFGIYFAIIIGVVKKVFPFLVVLLFIVLGYAQAFFIVLRSNSINDDNDPRNVATKYVFVNPDGTITVYNLLTGDSGSLLSFTYREHSIMTILLVTFTFFTVIYFMNLFIGTNRLCLIILHLSITKQNIEFKEDLIKQNVELKQQLEQKDNEEVQDNEKIQDNKGEQDNKLEMQKEQTKEELSKQKLDLNNK
ncbi:hypothetical protein RhiirB3_435726 [Rhizophagus irregularis]|nr:hypothetical protein RhiirB3_435726 [Rhizophagus irregularis]